MSRDTDPQERLWQSFGYGHKSSAPTTWRYWEEPKGSKQWIISAPNDLVRFEQRDKTVFYKGEAIHTAETQWLATWRALAYFYDQVVPTLPRPAIGEKK